MQDTEPGTHVLTWVVNGASLGAVVSSMLGWIPPFAALIALVWYLIQIYESRTVRRLFERRRIRRIAAYHAAIKVLQVRGELEDAEDAKSKQGAKT